MSHGPPAGAFPPGPRLCDPLFTRTLTPGAHYALVVTCARGLASNVRRAGGHPRGSRRVQSDIAGLIQYLAANGARNQTHCSFMSKNGH